MILFDKVPPGLRVSSVRHDKLSPFIVMSDISDGFKTNQWVSNETFCVHPWHTHHQRLVNKFYHDGLIFGRDSAANFIRKLWIQLTARPNNHPFRWYQKSKYPRWNSDCIYSENCAETLKKQMHQNRFGERRCLHELEHLARVYISDRYRGLFPSSELAEVNKIFDFILLLFESFHLQFVTGSKLIQKLCSSSETLSTSLIGPLSDRRRADRLWAHLASRIDFARGVLRAKFADQHCKKILKDGALA